MHAHSLGAILAVGVLKEDAVQIHVWLPYTEGYPHFQDLTPLKEAHGNPFNL